MVLGVRCMCLTQSDNVLTLHNMARQVYIYIPQFDRLSRDWCVWTVV